MLCLYSLFLEDKQPPSITANKGLTLDENSWKKITTQQLSATDQDSEPRELLFHITRQPSLGRLEHVGSPGTVSPFQANAEHIPKMSYLKFKMIYLVLVDFKGQLYSKLILDAVGKITCR